MKPFAGLAGLKAMLDGGNGGQNGGDPANFLDPTGEFAAAGAAVVVVVVVAALVTYAVLDAHARCAVRPQKPKGLDEGEQPIGPDDPTGLCIQACTVMFASNPPMWAQCVANCVARYGP